MKLRAPTFLLAELHESFRMGMSAIAAHKLRSALTLLGVLIGVFSIIVVMTAMRVLKNFVESNLSQLGGQTFAIQRWPQVQFGNDNDWEKYWRRKPISLANGRVAEEKATLAASIGIEGDFWQGTVQTRFQKKPNVHIFGETPGSFPAHEWLMAEGRALTDNDVDNARNVCIIGNSLATSVFPLGSAVGE